MKLNTIATVATIASSVFTIAAQAQAQAEDGPSYHLSCSSRSPAAALEIQDKSIPCQRLGFDFGVEFVKEGGKNEFCGQVVPKQAAVASLYSKTVINLTHRQSGEPGQLTIVERPKICGRAACDNSGLMTISAQLDFQGTSTYLSCWYAVGEK